MKKKESENYLTKVPLRKEGIRWEIDEQGLCTIVLSNRGFFHRVCQLLLKKPKESFVHLDEMGSFLWPLLNGEEDLLALGEKVKENFGEKAEPIYERLAKYIQILHSYGFISFVSEKG